MKRKLILFFLVLLIVNASSADVEQAYQENQLVLISDYDETLTGRAWNTLWFLKKIPPLKSYFPLAAIQALIPGATFESLPKEVAVTSREFGEILADRLAVVEANGVITPKASSLHTLPVLPGTPERSQPQSFIPGLYVVTEDTWERFRPDPSINFVLEDNERARIFEQATGESRFGPSYPILRLLTNSRRSVDHIHIVTARPQSSTEFQPLFQGWQREGFIKNIQGRRYTLDLRSPELASINIYGMGEGLSLLYGDSITERKIQTARDRIINQYLLLAKQQQKKFTVVVAENDPRTVASYVRMLQELMGIPDYQKHFEFIFLHAGTDFEVSRSGLPSRWVRIFGAFILPLEISDVKFLSSQTEPKTKKLPTSASISGAGLACSVLF